MGLGALKVVTREHEGGLKAPGLCVFTGETEGEFLDTGRYINYRDPYGYISVSFLEQMGREVGMVPKKEVRLLVDRLEALQDEMAELKERAEKLEHIEQIVKEVSNGTGS